MRSALSIVAFFALVAGAQAMPLAPLWSSSVGTDQIQVDSEKAKGIRLGHQGRNMMLHEEISPDKGRQWCERWCKKACDSAGCHKQCVSDCNK